MWKAYEIETFSRMKFSFLTWKQNIFTCQTCDRHMSNDMVQNRSCETLELKQLIHLQNDIPFNISRVKSCYWTHVFHIQNKRFIHINYFHMWHFDFTCGIRTFYMWDDWFKSDTVFEIFIEEGCIRLFMILRWKKLHKATDRICKQINEEISFWHLL